MSGADVQQTAREEAQIERHQLLGDRHEEPEERAAYGRYRIENEQHERTTPAVRMGHHQAHCVEAVGEVVGDDGGGNDGADFGGDPKCEPDSQAVRKGVTDERESRDQTDSGMMMRVAIRLGSDRKASDAVEQKKPEDEGCHRVARVELLTARQFEKLREEIEADDAEQNPQVSASARCLWRSNRNAAVPPRKVAMQVVAENRST